LVARQPPPPGMQRLRNLRAQIQGLGEKRDTTKKPPAPRLVALAQVSVGKSVIGRLASTSLSLPDRERARAESRDGRKCSSIGLEKGVDERSYTRGRGKNQEQSKK